MQIIGRSSGTVMVGAIVQLYDSINVWAVMLQTSPRLTIGQDTNIIVFVTNSAVPVS